MLVAATLGVPRTLAPEATLSAPTSSRDATELDAGPELSFNFANTTLVPSIDCMRVITLNDSKELPLFEQEARRVGFWHRVSVQVEHHDPDGAAAGCSRAHIRAWNWGADHNCSHLLVRSASTPPPQSARDAQPAPTTNAPLVCVHIRYSRTTCSSRTAHSTHGR